MRNNPINRFDPNGLTDYTLNKKTGDIQEVKYDDEAKQKANEESKTDRIVRTNRKGEIKTNRNGDARTAVGDDTHDFSRKLKLELIPKTKEEVFVSGDRISDFKEWLGKD